MNQHDRQFFESLTDTELLARCIWGEARGEDLRGKVAVACVVLNRVANGIGWDGTDIKSVILNPHQFSCFNPADPNFQRIRAPQMSGDQWRECLYVARAALDGLCVDLTRGATHYYADWLPIPPKWAAEMRLTVRIGRHLFYR